MVDSLVPKYILTHEGHHYLTPYTIWEQAEIDGKIAQKRESAFNRLEDALAHLGVLNNNKPIIIAYSTKLMDNSFKA